jgi:hypothetical protein
MKQKSTVLHSFEFETLLEALRRDMRTQLRMATADNALADWHKRNARNSQRILEALNPKSTQHAAWKHSSASSWYRVEVGR